MIGTRTQDVILCPVQARCGFCLGEFRQSLLQDLLLVLFSLPLRSFDTLIFVCVQAAAVQDRDLVLRDIEILKHNMKRADEIAMVERNRRIDAAVMSDRLQQEVIILKDAAAGNNLDTHPKVNVLNEKMSC